MERVVRSLFPTSRVERNNKELGLTSEVGNALEIDCYLPDLKLGFEYQVLLGEAGGGDIAFEPHQERGGRCN